MTVKANLALLNTTQFDSGALGMMAMVIHAFTVPGSHRGSVRQGGTVIGDLNFVVDEASTVMQLDIDLAMVARKAKPAGEDCGCELKNARPKRTVSPKGYVLFYASAGSGYSVSVAHESDKSRFDSTQLDKGDLFALLLLEPAQYEGTNILTKARLPITVEMLEGSPRELKARFGAIETANLVVTGGGFRPEKLHVVSAQGVVFQILEPSRIVIGKRPDSGQSKARVGPRARWQKPANALRAGVR
ncbi:MAG: hypothetical protein ABL931_18520 [Usitatibacteraceae bacterium]